MPAQKRITRQDCRTIASRSLSAAFQNKGPRHAPVELLDCIDSIITRADEAPWSGMIRRPAKAIIATSAVARNVVTFGVLKFGSMISFQTSIRCARAETYERAPFSQHQIKSVNRPYPHSTVEFSITYFRKIKLDCK